MKYLFDYFLHALVHGYAEWVAKVLERLVWPPILAYMAYQVCLLQMDGAGPDNSLKWLVLGGISGFAVVITAGVTVALVLNRLMMAIEREAKKRRSGSS
jgi:hypothetical protein